ncbi:MAG: glycosyltransferase [Bacteroidales bacterium]
MRILIANTHHYWGGGDSTYTLNLAQLLREYGHQISFFAMHNKQNLPDPNADLFVSHIDFRTLNRKKSFISAFKVLRRAIYSLEAEKKFRLLIKRFRPDIVHLQNIHHHITPSIIFEAKKIGLPVVWTLHDYKLICPNTHFFIDRKNTICEACSNNSFYQALLKKCKKDSLFASGVACIEAYIHRFIKVNDRIDFFLTPSKFLRNKLLHRNFSKEKVIHHPLFLPDCLFNYKESNENYFLFLGKIEPIKGVYHLLEACRALPKINLILAGRLEESMTDKFIKLLPKNVQYAGLKEGKELRNLIGNARALVLPSICYENQPLSILEAFACGKPVIASDIGGIPELVKDGERGILVPPADIKALTEALEWVSKNPSSVNRMGKNAYEYTKKEHNAEIHYQRLMKIYKKALN